MNKIKIKINNKPYLVKEGETVLQIARRNNISIPSLCDHDDFTHKENCRVCVVEIKGYKRLSTSCSTTVSNGMEIFTDSKRAKRARDVNLELIFSEHIEKCASCIWRFECKLLKYAHDYKILLTTFNDRKKNQITHKFKNAIEIDGTQCIDCRNCIDACSVMQEINYLEIAGKGSTQEIVPTKDKNVACILCGQCALHCPVSSAQEQAHYGVIENILSQDKMVAVAQFSPALSAGFGEDFGISADVRKKIVAGLKKIGFDYVYSTNQAEDIRTNNLKDKILQNLKSGGKKTIIDSKCPSAVYYFELMHPEFINYLFEHSTSYALNGILAKKNAALKSNTAIENIFLTSISPCTAHKQEILDPQLKTGNVGFVDCSITSRELSFMFKKKKIDLKKLSNMEFDKYAGQANRLSQLSDVVGGTAFMLLKLFDQKISKFPIKKINEDIFEFIFSFKGKDIRFAVVNGISNFKKIAKDVENYDYIELVACKTGCISGGGQQIPTNDKLRHKRASSILKVYDSSRKSSFLENSSETIKYIDKIKSEDESFDCFKTTFSDKSK